MNKLVSFFYTLAILILSGFAFQISAQAKEPSWDNTSDKKWSDVIQEVGIQSSKDAKIQKAMMYVSKSKTPQPLIVSLHTWSGHYKQADPISWEVVAKDWNYIHPDFRGANRKFEAMGSPLVISDLEDAVRYALEHTKADPQEVHIVGVSGGGHATLIAYMNIKYPVRSFSAWVPISDIEAWYWESVGRGQGYANDILQSISSDSTLDVEEARKRSPIYHKYPKDLRKNSNLYIYAGVHDGYKGSVPITHSLNMYNRLVGELKYRTTSEAKIALKANKDKDLISQKEIIELLSKRINPEYDSNATLFDRAIYLERSFKNIQLIIFEGRHEQLPQALELISKNIK